MLKVRKSASYTVKWLIQGHAELEANLAPGPGPGPLDFYSQSSSLFYQFLLANIHSEPSSAQSYLTHIVRRQSDVNSGECPAISSG